METMGAAERSSRSLHNFSLPPRLSWGAHKLLRCSNPNDAVSDHVAKKRRNASFRSPPPSIPRVSDNKDDQIEAIREKLMLDLRSEVDRMRAAILSSAEAETTAPPWNLRTRRHQMTSSPEKLSAAEGGGGAQREEFAVGLKREEIEEDYVEMTGRRPPRKPKKRPRYVQKQLDTLFPGLWLSEISADMYKVEENQEPAK